ncbi:MAG: arginine--tRNA ligase, partial [Deltaproteobacteria bacterium]|nr:arginine--tRNA ligase [Deltaproteobacteria bacterium]
EIEKNEVIKKCDVAGPGFINIYLDVSYWHELLKEIVSDSSNCGRSIVGNGKKIQVEYVSANPTGPLHIGHGRGAAVGDSLARIMSAAGFDVTREYYINDVGNQMQTLGASLYLRYKELVGEKIKFPDDHYKGEYMVDVAKDFQKEVGDKYKDVSLDKCQDIFTEFASKSIMQGIKKDLEEFSVGFDVYYSEKTLHEKGLVEKTINKLKELGHIYEDGGALWFRSTDFGDDKDRVLKKTDGTLTYFAADIAYHSEKIERGFERIIDVWGADHHGYKPRMVALFRSLKEDDDKLKIIFIQLVSLLRDGEPVAMSTRAGEFVTLKEVVDEVGPDACRFFFLMRKSDAQLDFDLELAKKQAPENPVYYVQYCHARVKSIIGHAKEKSTLIPQLNAEYPIEIFRKLISKQEVSLIKTVAAFSEVIEKSAVEMEPHRIAFYLQGLAGEFHSFYNASRVVTEDKELTEARLLLCQAVALVVKKGLKLVGVKAPDKM